MPRGKGKALQFRKTEPPAAVEAKFILKVSLSLHFRDPGEPTHPHQVTGDMHWWFPHDLMELKVPLLLSQCNAFIGCRVNKPCHS